MAGAISTNHLHLAGSFVAVGSYLGPSGGQLSTQPARKVILFHALGMDRQLLQA
jgi:hypothetical protein